ncbi:MAG: TIGR02147 family protein [Proteobacteria bacterium]|nr:MAG: TIGR02147 family protein [Pseudomonadota bacterium]
MTAEKAAAWHSEFTQLLSAELEKARKKNHRVSLRSFATRLGISAGSLSDLLNGRGSWMLSESRAEEILSKLDLSEAERNRFLVKLNRPPVSVVNELPKANYAFLESWFYYPILFSFDLPAPLRTFAAIAARLALPLQTVEKAVAELVEAKLLINEGGIISRPKTYVTTSDGPRDSSVKAFHRDSLQLAERSLEAHDPARRDFTSLTFVGSPAQAKELKEEIRKLMAKATTIVDAGDANSAVFRLNMQFFPIDFEER